MAEKTEEIKEPKKTMAEKTMQKAQARKIKRK